MAGSKPLSSDEVSRIVTLLSSPRDRALFVVGVYTGFRISELLSLKVKNCYQNGHVLERILVERRHMKGKRTSRAVPLHKEAICYLELYIESDWSSDRLIFDISRSQAHRIIKAAVDKAEIEGRVSTHSMRKTFAKRIYYALGKDLVNTQKAMGHASVSSTVAYLSFDQEEIDKAILGKI